MIYTKPIETITWDDIETFCKQGTPEGAFLDYKEDFPKHLEKTIAAMANTFGGIIIIGASEDDRNKPEVPLRGIEFKRGLSERVMSIILDNITPPVFPEIKVCDNPDSSRAAVLIRVPQSHQTPHAITGNTSVYLRTGDRTKPEELAEIKEVRWLLDHRIKSEQLRDTLNTQANERFDSFYNKQLRDAKAIDSKLTDGLLTISLCPYYPKDVYLTPPEMRPLFEKIRVIGYSIAEDFFPITNNIHGTIVQDGVVFDGRTFNELYKTGQFYYSEINSFGLYFFKQTLLSEYYVNQVRPSQPQTSIMVLNSLELFCRLYEFLDSAKVFYKELGYWGYLQFNVFLDNINEYSLLKYPSEAYWSYGPFANCPDSKVRFTEVAIASELDANRNQLIYRAVRQIGWAFDWDIPEGLLERVRKERRIP